MTKRPSKVMPWINDHVSSRDGSPKRGRCNLSGRPSPKAGNRIANAKAGAAAAQHHESRTRPGNLANQGADHEAADRSGRDDRAHSAAAPRRTGRLGGRQRLGCDVHRGERQTPQQPGDEQRPYAGQAGVTHCREQRTHRCQQAGSPRSSLGIEAGDPAATGDPHQAVGGEQQPSFGERHTILVVVERQE
jgi:hypothetical protein